MTPEQIVQQAEFEKFRKMLHDLINAMDIEDQAIFAINSKVRGKPKLRTVSKSSVLFTAKVIQNLEAKILDQLTGNENNKWGNSKQN